MGTLGEAQHRHESGRDPERLPETGKDRRTETLGFRGIWELSELSLPLFCRSKSILKENVYFQKSIYCMKHPFCPDHTVLEGLVYCSAFKEAL